MKTKAEIKCLCTVEASSFLVPCPWDSSGQEGHTRVRMRGNTVHSQLQGECDGQHAIASVATAFSQDGSKPAQGAVRDASQRLRLCSRSVHCSWFLVRNGKRCRPTAARYASSYRFSS